MGVRFYIVRYDPEKRIMATPLSDMTACTNSIVSQLRYVKLVLSNVCLASIIYEIAINQAWIKNLSELIPSKYDQLVSVITYGHPYGNGIIDISLIELGDHIHIPEVKRKCLEALNIEHSVELDILLCNNIE